MEVYLDKTQKSFRESEHVCVCLPIQQRKRALSKEHLLYWIIEAIKLVYSVKGQKARQLIEYLLDFI